MHFAVTISHSSSPPESILLKIFPSIFVCLLFSEFSYGCLYDYEWEFTYWMLDRFIGYTMGKMLSSLPELIMSP